MLGIIWISGAFDGLIRAINVGFGLGGGP
jgi:hypothetical protein